LTTLLPTHAFGVDDVELLWGNLFQILFVVWPTLSEQKWIIFRECRSAITFSSGVNVLIGENKTGKTTVIGALGLLLDQRSRRRPGFFDFHHPPIELAIPPSIRITATFRSSLTDTIEDKALVAAWLTDGKANNMSPGIHTLHHFGS